MVDPSIMCRKHLLGEHVELHMFVGAMQHNKNLIGYFKDGLLEVDGIIERHNVIVQEMENRGYKHKSPITMEHLVNAGWRWYLQEYVGFWSIDKDKSLRELINRCDECRIRYENLDKEIL